MPRAMAAARRTSSSTSAQASSNSPSPTRRDRSRTATSKRAVTASAACASAPHSSGCPRDEPQIRSFRGPRPNALHRTGDASMSDRIVRVVLVDDDDLMRAGLKAVLPSDPSVQVVGEAGDGSAAVTRVLELEPDVVLMDVRMPHLDGIAATREVHARRPDAKVVILTTFEQDDYIFGALKAGAS